MNEAKGVCSELFYEQRDRTPPNYVIRQIPVNNPQISLQVSNNLQCRAEFTIPAGEVVNLAKTRLVYTLTGPTPTAATVYPWYRVWCHSLITRVELISRNGSVKLVDLQYAHKYADVAIPLHTTLAEGLTRDCRPSGDDVSHVLPQGAAGESSATISGPCPVGITTCLKIENPGVAAVNGYSSHNEMLQCITSADTKDEAKAAKTLRFIVPLKDYADTLLGVDKDLWFAGNELTLAFTFGYTTWFAFNGTSTTDPTPISASSVVYTISSANLYLAVEEDPVVKALVISELTKLGSIIIPWVQQNIITATSTNQQIQVPLNSSAGISIRRVYHCVYTNGDAINLALDRSNLPNATPYQDGTKITSYQTFWDNKPIQNYTVYTSTIIADDYAINKKFLLGTMIGGPREYRRYWFHIDDFQDTYSDDDMRNNKISGKKLFTHNISWEFKATMKAATTMEHVTNIVVNRRMHFNALMQLSNV